MKIVFATNNKHKLEEIRHLAGKQIKIASLKDIGCFEDIPETGNTLEKNALQKANYIHNKYNMDCFADDTGLEIEALENRPGVYSARYAGPEQDSLENISKVLEEMQGKSSRKARFRTVIALILDNKNYFFEGIVNGSIIKENRGTEGFGYDPVFLPDGYEQTFAEMCLEEKNKISHRARATRKLIGFLQSILK